MPASSANERLFLVDAHSLIFQVFHAIPEMSSPDGMPTNALFGFTRDMVYLRTEMKPDYLVCAFDMPGPTFRDKIHHDYKAHRPPPPVDLTTQLPLIMQMLEGMGIPVLGLEGFEADDVIATLAARASQQGMDVFVCTNDKDCRQLVDDRTCIFNLRKKTVLDRAALLEEWGIKPDQVIDLQALAGDSVDNVPGVPGIGIKTAAKLLQEFGSLDNILANIERVAGAKKQESLRATREQVAISRQLVTLRRDVPIEIDWDGWRLRDCNADRLIELFQSWGFRALTEQARSWKREQACDSERALQQTDLFPSGVEHPVSDGQAVAKTRELRPIQPSEVNYRLVDTPEAFAEFCGLLGQHKRFAIDLETTCLSPGEAKIVGIAVSWQPGEAWYLPLRGPEGSRLLSESETLEKLRTILEDPSFIKVNQNIKYDILGLRNNGLRLAGVGSDPMVADYLLHAGERSHNLADLASRYLDRRVTPITDLIGKNGKKQLRMDEVPTWRVAQYSGEDADMAWQLSEQLDSQVRQAGLEPLYRDLELPLIEVLAEMEYIGIRLDIPLLRRLASEMAGQLQAIESEIHELAGREFNIASPRQLRQVLFDEMSLPAQRRTGTTGEASTDQETLERLAALGYELPQKIIEHRQIAKLKGTYVDALPGLVNPVTGRVHASFNQTVAATGRLSSSDPNLQNIPVRTEQGRQIRQAFLPEEGWQLLTADYSQIELRLLAHLSADQELRRAFAEDRDVHTSVAAQIFGVAEPEVTADMRRMAKTVNFGVIYGMSAHGLAQRLGMPREEAGRFIDAYFARYPKVLDYQTRLLQDCRRNRYVSTILGRRREITGIRSNSTYQQRNQPEREAVNMQIQGSAADLIKLAMLHIHQRLEKEERRARMLLQIHDELVFEVPPEELEEVAALVALEMTTPLEKQLELEVPLKVDLAVGPNWLDVEEWNMTLTGSP
jgi:DNA polymerase-1